MRPEATRRVVIIYATVLTTLVVILVLGQALSAQSGGQYDLSWSSVAGGGETFSTGGAYVLGGTMGQPGAGRLAGGDYQLEGGFWHCFPLAFADCVSANPNSVTYLPIITVPDH